MRKRIFIVLLVLFAVVIGVIVLPELFSKEPKYRGKTAEGWFKQYYRTRSSVADADRDPHRDALDALRVLSTNSIPTLLNKYYATNENTAFEYGIMRGCKKFPASWNFEPIIPVSSLAWEAEEAITAMRPTEKLLLSHVSNRLYGSEHDRLRSLHLLAELGLVNDEVLAILSQLLMGTNRDHRDLARACLHQYGPAARSAVPTLAKVVGSDTTDSREIYYACQLLIKFPHESAAAIPALKVRWAKELDPMYQLKFATAICLIDARQTDVLQFLINAAANKTNEMRDSAIGSLGLIGTNATSAGSVLAEAAKEKEVGIWQSAADALVETGRPDLMESVVMGKLQDTNLSLRSTAVLYLLKQNPSNSMANDCALRLIRDESTGSYVIFRLGELNQLPKRIEIELLTIVADRNHRFHREAQHTVRRVGQLITYTNEEMQAREEMMARYGLRP